MLFLFLAFATSVGGYRSLRYTHVVGQTDSYTCGAVVMATLLSYAVTVGATPVSVTPTPLSRRRVVIVQNTGTNPAHLGDSSVAATTGLRLGAGTG